jgi:DNA-binding MarR family transcriptional regulator/GNAT superfamily N-acetyltransferase
MQEQAIATMRRFNRVVTERVGAIDETFLDRGRPYGETRLLWEIGPEGADVRDLRARLGIDAGYASRLLRSLEERGLAEVAESETDRRVRHARLTRAGLAERAEIDRLSDELVVTTLEPLGKRQRERLLAAMDEVERLLRASLITIEVADADSPDGRWCLEQYFAELDRRFEGGFDLGAALPADLNPPAGLMLMARLHGRAVGCGGLKFTDQGTEIKRMWVAPEVRGLGLGARLLRELERAAAARGADVVRLDTNRTLVEAIAMYRRSGYEEIPAFTDEPHAHHWFEKRLEPL